MLNPSNEKLNQFVELYIENGFNAVKACLAMGMKPKTAKGNAFRYKRLAEIPLARALRAIGLDEVSQARKLGNLREARMPMWNPKTLQWDVFDNLTIQLEATKEINKILGAYPLHGTKQRGDDITVIFAVPTTPPWPKPKRD